MKKRTTRRALVMSLLSLLLCCSMLVGTTFAWFTDSVTSGKNKIIAGNLDVELYYQNDTTSDWTKVGTETNVFKTDTLWEPGHTEVVKLKVVNEGTLALKYQLGVNVASEIGSINKDGNPFKLSDYIKFAVIEGDNTYTREQAVAAAEAADATALNEAYNSGTLELASKAEKVVTMVVYMPTTVDNKANYGKDQVIPEILLGLTINATQLTAEKDSFDENYDKDAWMDALHASSIEELMLALETVEDGGLIVLADNMVFDAEHNYDWNDGYIDGIVFDGDKSFTLDLGGNTITHDSAINDYLMNFRNTGSKPNVITLKNGTLEAGPTAYCAISTSTASTQKITINLENINIIGNNSNGAVVKVRKGAELNVKAGTKITGKNNYVGIECWNATVNVFEGAEIYQNGTTSYVGSLVGVSGNGVANVYGGSGKSASGCFIAMTSGGIINVSGGEWIANTDGTIVNGDNKGALIAQSQSGAKSIVNVTGGTFEGGYCCYGDAAGDAQINISGGNFNADPTTYVAANFEAEQNADGTWTVGRNYNIVTAPSEDKAVNGAALAEAINTTTTPYIQLGAGEYTMPSITGAKEITITGTEDTVIDNTMGSYMDSSKISFEGVTIKGSTGKANGNGSDYAALYSPNVTYTNCTFDGPFRIGRDGATFIGCTFTNLGNDYVWTYGNDCTFIDCTFNSDGKALLIYSDGGNEVSEVTVKDCTFNATQGAKAGAISNQNCAAIEIQNYGNGVNLTTSGNTIDTEFSGEWRIKTYETGKPAVIVNGVTYTTIALDGKLMTISGTTVTVQ